MRKLGKIVGRVLLGLCVAVYVLVAALNYSVVQSFVGRLASERVEQVVGGTVRIGAMHVMPWDHVLLKGVLVVDPTGDTILDAGSLRIHFKKFPYTDMHLDLQRVVLRDAYFHLDVHNNPLTGKEETNMQYLFDHLGGNNDTTTSDAVFTVDVRHFTGRRLHYKQDLIDEGIVHYAEGVNIAHMEFNDINLRARNIHVENDDVKVQLLQMSTTERSGFRVNQIQGDVHVGPNGIIVHDFRTETPQSLIVADCEILYDGWNGMSDYLADVRHNITLHSGTSVALADAAYWAPVLWGINAQVEAEGHMEGSIGNMHLTDFAVHWGDESSLRLMGDVRGLPDIETTVFDLDIERLRTNRADLEALGLLRGVGHHPTAHYAQIDVPDILLRHIGFVDLGLRLHGGWSAPSTANLQLASAMGHLDADLSAQPDGKGGLGFSAEVGSTTLRLGILESEWLTQSGFELAAHGHCTQMTDLASYTAEAEGRLFNSMVRGQDLDMADLQLEVAGGRGHFDVECQDSLLEMVIKGDFDMGDQQSKLTTQLNVKQANLAAFGLLPEKLGQLGLLAELHYEGTNLDTMQTTLRTTSLRLGEVYVNNLDIDASSNGEAKKMLIESDMLRASLSGHFDYPAIPLIALKVARQSLPQVVAHIDSLFPFEEQMIEHSDLALQLRWIDNGDLLRTLEAPFGIAQGTTFTANYAAYTGMRIALRSDSVALGGVCLDGIGLIGHSDAGGCHLDAEAQEVLVAGNPWMQRAQVQLLSGIDSAMLSVAWSSDDGTTDGDLALRLQGNEISVVRPHFSAMGQQWTLEAEHLWLLSGDQLGLQGEGISVYTGDQRMDAKLRLAGEATDYLALNFQQFEVGDLFNLLAPASPIKASGRLGGQFSLYGLAETPYFNASMRIDSCMVGPQPLGDLTLRSTWNAELNTINVDLQGNALAAEGWLGLDKDSTELHIDARFDSLQLTLLAPLMTDFSDRFEGLLHANLDIRGTTAQPRLQGEALVEDGAMKVDLTGVTYFFSDSIWFDNSTIALRQFAIRDPQGNTAHVDGQIHYDDLQHINLDLALNTDGITVIDRLSGDEFYGHVVAAATGSVQGEPDAMRIGMQARTLPGCNITVPINDSRQVHTLEYIAFVSDKPLSPTPSAARRNSGGVVVDLDLAITPDVELNLPMDFSSVSVQVGAHGAGDLHVNLQGNEAPTVVGSYEITSGTLKLGLLSIIDKSFSLEPGSSLDFPGNIEDARFDLSAVYSQRVNLSTLTGSVSEVGGTQKYVQVEDVINIAGSLQEPTLKFDIRLPNVDASVEEEVFAYIDRNSERDMINQSMSILINGKFYNANASAVDAGSATSGGIGTLAGALTDMVTVVDIDVDYKTGNELVKDQLDVNISKDWGRWYLESTLGYGGESRELADGQANSAVFDALLGYRISQLVHLYAYNRTNTNDYTRTDLPYKQGVGLKLTRDFDRWTDLFHKQKK